MRILFRLPTSSAIALNTGTQRPRFATYTTKGAETFPALTLRDLQLEARSLVLSPLAGPANGNIHSRGGFL